MPKRAKLQVVVRTISSGLLDLLHYFIEVRYLRKTRHRKHLQIQRQLLQFQVSGLAQFLMDFRFGVASLKPESLDFTLHFLR